MEYGAPGSSAIVGAVAWVQGLLLGPLATTIAVIAVAWTGMLMLGGRIDWQRGVRVILGCFIVFGALGIASGLMLLAGGGSASIETTNSAPTRNLIPSRDRPPPASGDPYDPYGGAGVPTNR